MSEPEDDLELQALQRQLDDAFETTRPRPGFEDDLWLRMQSRRPFSSRVRDALAGLFQGIRAVPAVPLASVAAVLVVVIGVGIFSLSGLGRGGASSTSGSLAAQRWKRRRNVPGLPDPLAASPRLPWLRAARTRYPSSTRRPRSRRRRVRRSRHSDVGGPATTSRSAPRRCSATRSRRSIRCRPVRGFSGRRVGAQAGRIPRPVHGLGLHADRARHGPGAGCRNRRISSSPPPRSRASQPRGRSRPTSPSCSSPSTAWRRNGHTRLSSTEPPTSSRSISCASSTRQATGSPTS